MDDKYEKAHHATKEGESSLFCVQIDVSQFSAYTVKEEFLLQPIRMKQRKISQFLVRELPLASGSQVCC